MKPLAQESVAELLSAADLVKAAMVRELERDNASAMVSLACRWDEIRKLAEDGIGA